MNKHLLGKLFLVLVLKYYNYNEKKKFHQKKRRRNKKLKRFVTIYLYKRIKGLEVRYK